jgi:predicted MPP superfamily phosphohydrolase
MVRIAAAGDVHASEATRSRAAAAFAAVEREADLVLLAGDLTTQGEPEQAEVLAEATRGLHVPVVAVLGNHDLHAGHGEEISSILSEAGLRVLDREAIVLELARALREQVDWDDVRDRTRDSPFAKAYFTLLDELEIVPA